MIVRSAFQVMAARDARRREQAQAVAHPARVRFRIEMDGVGEARLEGPAALAFGAKLLDEPIVTTGLSMEQDQTLAFGELPLATAVVTAWVRDAYGLYEGAEMAFRMDALRTDIVAHFNVVFEGYALPTTAGFEGELQGPYVPGG